MANIDGHGSVDSLLDIFDQEELDSSDHFVTDNDKEQKIEEKNQSNENNDNTQDTLNTEQSTTITNRNSTEYEWRPLRRILASFRNEFVFI